MNEVLNNLCSAYLNDGTGSVVAYYSFESGSVWHIGSNQNFTGVFRNQSPAYTVGDYDLIVLNSSGHSASASRDNVLNNIVDDSFDLTYSSCQYGGFSGISFLNPDDYDSDFVYLFSFEKTSYQNGVLFGSLVKDSFDNGTISFEYGRGFNVGVNDRNQLFFQGSDSNIGDYILTADQIELSNANICSVQISPYNISFSSYNLADDKFYSQSLSPNCKIQNNSFSEPMFVGQSPTYVKSGRSFSGYIHDLLIISGAYGPTDLKSIASGFVSSGVISSGVSYSDEVITGYSIQLLSQSGVTGYEPVITGYLDSISGSEFIQFVLSSTTQPVTGDGRRFITGYDLPTNSGSYLEETSFLVPSTQYRPTGNDAFATLGLTNQSDVVETYSLVYTRIDNTITGAIPLYGLVPKTGILLSSATGYIKTPLTANFSRTGDLSTSLSILPQYTGFFKKDFIYFLEERL